MNYSKNNTAWESKTNSFFSVITPVFNRPQALLRLIESVKKQTFKDFEYIIVNDGSTEDIKSLVETFMETTDLPVLYIEKPNGGVHTARNEGIKNARGYITLMIDSDDELTEDALSVFHKAWTDIPQTERETYFQISARCKTESGQEGPVFPEEINTLPVEKAAILYEKVPFEIVITNKTCVLKENPFPEPEGITFVLESILWFKLLRQYRVKCINNILRIYHTEGSDHVFNKTKSIQYVKNMVWSFAFFLNNWKERKTHLKNYTGMILKYCVLRKVLFIRGVKIRKDFKLKNIREKILYLFLFLPSYVAALFYNKKVN